MTISQNTVVAVVGLGYVGLPLAVEFAKKYKTIGFDLSESKVLSYRKYCDPTDEVTVEQLRAAMRPGGLTATTDPTGLVSADFVVVAVPTPVDDARNPDLSSLISASITVGRHMRVGATIVYESTVYPGATEEICIPILERESGLKCKRDFHVGYSPERINPGDKEHTITKIVKVVSGDDETSLQAIGDLYDSIIVAGVYRASSIQVAEAAKVIENTQRDLNIALMNELSIIFDRMNIDTYEVLSAAKTKWNFLNFSPGLVGGHCIGVDPYYLTHKAEMLGYQSQVILAGRRINDSMGKFIAEKVVKRLAQSGGPVKGAKVVVLGLTFKENCSDLRNSKVPDIIEELKSYGVEVYVHDPVARRAEALSEYEIKLFSWDTLPVADAIIIAVAHDVYKEVGAKRIAGYLKSGGSIGDVKALFERDAFGSVPVWTL